ncbi:MAG: Rieske (2Fe-2S) protein [Nitrospinae bacterium]|nr:Rieske (2Fe-2S) protein [Nitrospinota bacterium]
MAKHLVCKISELPPGARKIIDVEGRSIGVFNIKNALYAVRNSCPHQGAPLCLGKVKGTMKSSKPHTYEYVMDEQIIVCPWHCWEFDITNGRSVFNPHRMRVKTYEVTLEAEEDPSIETYEVTLEKDLVMVHV